MGLAQQLHTFQYFLEAALLVSLLTAAWTSIVASDLFWLGNCGWV